MSPAVAGVSRFVLSDGRTAVFHLVTFTKRGVKIVMRGKPQWRRRALAMASALTVSATILVAPAAARADEPARDPATDRQNLTWVWSHAGPMVRAEAGQALVGTDADVEAFVTTGWDQAQQLDERAAVEQLMAQGGQSERDEAQAALDSNDPATIKTFLTSGWQAPWQTDLRVRVDEMIDAGGANTKRAAQAALDSFDAGGNSEYLEDFVDDGFKKPYQTDLRIQVDGILAAGGPLVQQAAQAALDTDTIDAYTQFIGSGWALATARDQEQATIADLTGSAVAAAAEATRQAQETDEAAKKAAAAAAAAKAAAKTAADLAASAHSNAAAAAAAAQEAATAAENAASAATEAINAANAATSAARAAASAASRAAAAATRASDAATAAYQAASAAEAKAGDAKTARTAAQKARDTAQNAKTAAQAAVNAGTAAKKAAQGAATAANGAAVDAKNAADAADQAASASGDASADAQRAHKEAAIARSNAARAQRAANAAASFAQTAADAASTAATAADKAADDANGAADAADKAADAAGTAQKDAAAATTHAAAAAAAANDAITAVTAAHAVHDAAVQAENNEVDLQGEQADQAAVAANDAVAAIDAQTDAAAEEAAARTAQTNQWIAEADALTTPADTALADARKVALDLADNGGPWVKEAAMTALGGPDDVALDFVRNQLSQDTAYDDRDKLTAMADAALGTGTASFKAAANAALAGSDGEVATFLTTQSYPQKSTDLRVNVDGVLASAQADSDNNVIHAAQAALDDGSVASMQKFLTQDEDKALATDERIKVDAIIVAENQRTQNTPLHSKTALMAQAALDGPGALVHQFLTSDQFNSEQYDQQAAEFDAEMQSMLSHADQVVALAAQKADTAQSVAADARGDAKAAGDYKTAAANSASAAATDATKAKASADAAQASADRAAASAKQAQDAANRAASAAHDAERSAAAADQSAREAAASATAAQQDAARAHDAAVAAHKDAVAANQAARDAVAAANQKVQAAQAAARAKVEQACHAYLDKGGDGAQANYNNCLDIAAMNTQQRADLAARNAATCQTLFPNHSSKQFNSCLQNTLDPAFSSDESAIVKQMNDSGKWWKVGLKIGIGVILAAGAVACILIEPCGAIAAGVLEVGSAILEAATPLLAPELYGLVAATSSSFLLGGGVAVAEVGIGASIESDLATSVVADSDAEESVLSQLRDPESVPESCTKSFSADTRVVMADRTVRPIAQVQPGDAVLSTDVATARTGGEVVTAVDRHIDNDVVDVDTSTGGHSNPTIETTANHLFWSETGHAWAVASQLRPGEGLLSANGGEVPRVVRVRPIGGSREMSDLTVAKSHSFYVLAGSTSVLVHNDFPCVAAGTPKARPGRDVFPDANGNIHPPTADNLADLDVHGASTYDTVENLEAAGLTGQVRAPNSPIPAGLAQIRDGEEVGGTQPRGHITFYPTKAMTVEQFNELLKGMDWQNINIKLPR